MFTSKSAAPCTIEVYELLLLFFYIAILTFCAVQKAPVLHMILLSKI